MTSSLQVAKDLFCGCAAGWGQVITMLPFENLKVKVISKPQEYSQGYIQAFKKTVREEGFLSFYKGMLMPLLGVGALAAIQFGFVQSLKKMIKQRYADAQGNLHWKYSFLSGLIAGFPSSLITTVLDHSRFRVLLLKQKGAGSVKTAINIYQNYGLQKLYLGFYSTWLRQSYLGVYFGVYDGFMAYSKKHNINLELAALISGAMAGTITLFLNYPIDYVKTKMQSDSLDNPKYKSSIDCLRKQVAENGAKVVFRGFNIMLVRSIVVNAFGFLCFEYAKKLVYSPQQSIMNERLQII